MVHIVSIADIGALVGDPPRANMLEALMDRRALTAKELATRAGVAPQTASGHLAVSVTDAMLDRGEIEFDGDGGSVTGAGKLFLEKLGIDLAAATQSKRVFCRPCLDWSERRFHLPGAVGAALLHRTLELNWVKRQDNTRGLAITRAGDQGFRKTFGIEPVS